MFGNPETTPGGLAMKFYASVRVDIRKVANIKTSTGDTVGSQHRARIIKNKVAPPFKQAEFDIMNDEGISVVGGILDMAIENNLITKAGAFFKIGKETIGQGREGAKDYLRKNPKVCDQLCSQLWKIASPKTSNDQD